MNLGFFVKCAGNGTFFLIENLIIENGECGTTGKLHRHGSCLTNKLNY
jgi:hypothetical protein